MAYEAISDFVLDQVLGYQTANFIKNNIVATLSSRLERSFGGSRQNSVNFNGTYDVIEHRDIEIDSTNLTGLSVRARVEGKTDNATTTLLIGGAVITVDQERRVLDPGAVAIQADRIVAVGSPDELTSQYPDAEKVNLQHAAILPGLVDSHGHAGHGMTKALHDGHDDWLDLVAQVYFRASDVEFWLLSLAVEERSGREIAREYKKEVGRSISYGTLYTTFRRLKEAGWVRVREDEDVDGRVRFFQTSGAGLRALASARSHHRAMAEFRPAVG